MASSALRSASSLPMRSFSAELSKGLGRVPSRFVQQMMVGIHRAQSLRLTDIARSLGEDIDLHATHKRLSRNLTKKALTEFIANALLQRAAQDVTQDMVLVVSHYSLNKRFASRMEYARGNDGKSHDDGYHICDISGVDPSLPDRYIPLLSRLWSRHAPDYHSDEAETLTAINQVHSATDGRGVFYFEETTPSHIVWPHLHRSDLRTMSRLFSQETVFIVDEQLSALSGLVSRELPHGKLMFKVVPGAIARRDLARSDNEPFELALFVEFGGMPVRLPDTGKPATLILTRSAGHRDNRTAAPTLGHLATGDIEASTPDQLWSLLRNYNLAEDVARVVINHRSRFNQSDFRVLTYDRLQLLNVLLQAVTHFEACVEGTFRMEEHRITGQPHGGNHPRDFMVPGRISRQ